MKLSLTDYIAGISFLLSLIFFLNPKLEKNRMWVATVTPLASIIGSGYLVSAPLLYFVLGDYAILGMAGIVFLAYLIGEAIRYNISKGEPLVYGRYKFRGQVFLQELDRFSSLALAFAYMISVAFYLRLLSAFVFSGFLERNHLYENLFTSLLLLFIGVSGFLRGLDFLEFMEKYAVALKLSVIFAFLTTLFVHDFQGFELRGVFKEVNFESLRILAGILLIVQGFETSKYLSEKYTPEERVKSMKLAQLISGFIYVSFILLATPLLYELDPNEVDETAVITLATSISLLLGYLIRLGPLMSQFSAAVADTAGAGGLIQEETKGRVSSRLGYLLVSFVGLILVWSVNIFEIIAYASKAFAFYYLLQVIFAFWVSLYKKDLGYFFLFLLLIPILVFITLAGRSAE